jgi:hypothetical protein
MVGQTGIAVNLALRSLCARVTNLKKVKSCAERRMRMHRLSAP